MEILPDACQKTKKNTKEHEQSGGRGRSNLIGYKSPKQKQCIGLDKKGIVDYLNF